MAVADAESLQASVPAKPQAVPTAEPSTESTAALLLDKLRSPAPSDLSRKRKLAVNTPGNPRRVGSNSKIFGMFRNCSRYLAEKSEIFKKNLRNFRKHM